ncbi:KDGP aldolase [Enemella sp. A6]|uniref:KDGP aldolase n=1 Tax=Enemella sp. A6 TaxID=3440152 RepID=UPI003EB86E55
MTTVELNVLSRDLDNAVDITAAAPGRVYCGVLMKDHPDTDSGAAAVREHLAAGVRVSVGLGDGDPTMWRRVAEVTALTSPPHANQVFPAAGYTLGRIEQVGATTLVNALVGPGSRPGLVRIGTGPESSDAECEVPAEFAAVLLAEIGVPSVKFFPIKGTQKLDHLEAMVRAATANGIEMFEPTGGIEPAHVPQIVDVCLSNGATHVVPHVYSSIVDKQTGLTDPGQVAAIIEAIG